MQASLAGRFQPAGGNGSMAGPLMPFSVVDASRALPGADGYVFPVKTATIKVRCYAACPGDALFSAALHCCPSQGDHQGVLLSLLHTAHCALRF